jgi:hypothetical protein
VLLTVNDRRVVSPARVEGAAALASFLFSRNLKGLVTGLAMAHKTSEIHVCLHSAVFNFSSPDATDCDTKEIFIIF